MRRGRTIALAVAGTAVVVSGCGSGGGGSAKSKPATRSELIAKANPVCKQIKDKITYYSNLRPSNSKDLLSSTAISKAAPRIASLERSAGVKLQKLTPPDSISQDWKQIVDGLLTLADDTQRLAQSIQAENRETTMAIATSSANLLQRINTAAERNGFKDCVNLTS